jgi:hypothetical protein
MRAPAFPAAGRYIDGAALDAMSAEDRLTLRAYAPLVGILRKFALAVHPAEVDEVVRKLLRRSLSLASLATWSGAVEFANDNSILIQLNEVELQELNDPERFFFDLCMVLPRPTLMCRDLG